MLGVRESLRHPEEPLGGGPPTRSSTSSLLSELHPPPSPARRLASSVQVLEPELRALTLLAASPCALVSSDLIIKGSHVTSIYGSGVVWGEEAHSK